MRVHPLPSLAALILACLPAACLAPVQEAPSDRPYVLVLGTAQDAGLPQIGCREPCCTAARADPAARRLVASLLIVDPAGRNRWLVDATPDLPEQVERAWGHPTTRSEVGPRPPLVDGIFLTHAHMGHYTGLLHLGREAYASRSLPVIGSESMLTFLETHEPWAFLVRQQHLVPHRAEPLRRVPLRTDPRTGRHVLAVTPLSVPHREEWTDTYAYLVSGPERTLLYVPDIDSWDAWEQSLPRWLEQVDVALVDGTFYEQDEIPGRSMADIGHPFITETIALLASLPPELRAKVHFTHLNHTNPAADPDSAASAHIEAAGMSVAREGQVFVL